MATDGHGGGVTFFESICSLTHETAPACAAMRADRGYKNWGPDLLALARHDCLDPFRRVLADIVEDGLSTTRPLVRFAREEASSLDNIGQCSASYPLAHG
jgi:hypothetical protein